MLDISSYPLADLAEKVGTPYFLYDGTTLDKSLSRLTALAEGLPLSCRYAMKANPSQRILQAVQQAGLWIDAVSGNEVERARAAGFAGGQEPPVIMLTTDVFRDNALEAVARHNVLPNLGSPGMLKALCASGHKGAVALRVNPGFGHGHVSSCDTGGPSSKHGIWPEELPAVAQQAARNGLKVVALHAHVGTGPAFREFDENMKRLVGFYAELLPQFPDVESVNLGGGIPHPYKPGVEPYDLGFYRPILEAAAQVLEKAAGRPIRMEIEPGRYVVAGCGLLVSRVHDIKETRSNEKGPGHRFVMVDAGFNDLIRPAMYGSYHHIEVLGQGAGRAPEPLVVAGPLCESGDVFTRDDQELLDPRDLPRPEPDDLMVLHDAGAYAMAMSSNYVSLGRAPQIFWDGSQATLVSKRESIDDILRLETNEPL